MSTTTTLPSRLNAGDTLKFTTSTPDYLPSAGWSVELVLANAMSRYTATSTASGDEHLILVPAATTSGWAAGDYTARLRATKAGEVYTLIETRLTVAASLASAVDGRSQARRMLDAVEAVLEGRVTDGVASYSIAGRSLTKIPVPELLTLRDSLRVEVMREEAAERIARGLQPRGRIAVRFGA